MTRIHHPGRGWAGPMGASTGIAALLLETRDRLRRRTPGFRLIDQLLFDTGGGGGGGGGGGDPELTEELKTSDPSKYWQAYWKKEAGAAAAFTSRDETKRRIAELEKGQMTPEQRKEYADLKAAQAKADEEKKRKEGEFDAWRADIGKKHDEEIAARDKRLADLEQAIAHGEIRRAFLAETDYFGGGETSKTVLVGELAVDALGRYVSYEEHDFGGEIGKRKTLIVRGPDGRVIYGKNGGPAPFKEALDELLSKHPGKDHILRGSGKAGSGARGDGVLDDKSKVDLSRTLTREQLKDPKVREQLASVGKGGLQVGRAFTQIGKK